MRLRRHITKQRHRLLRLNQVPHKSSRTTQVQVVLSRIRRVRSLISNTVQILKNQHKPKAPLRTVSQTRVTILIHPLVPGVRIILRRPISIKKALRGPRRLVNRTFRRRNLNYRRQRMLQRIGTRLLTRRKGHTNTNTVKLRHTFNRSLTRRILVKRQGIHFKAYKSAKTGVYRLFFNRDRIRRYDLKTW